MPCKPWETSHMSYIFTERGLSWTGFSKYFHPRYYDGCTFWKSFKLWLKLAKQQIISKCQSAYLCTWLFHQIFLSHLKFWKILISAKAKRHRILQIHDTSLGIWLSCRFALRTKWRWGFAVIFLEIYLQILNVTVLFWANFTGKNQPLSISQHGGGVECKLSQG